MSALEAALAYAGRGWRVVPLHHAVDGRCSCGKADCASPAKHPRTPHGLKDASVDEATIRGWWKRWPHANVGIVTGPVSGLFVLDEDGATGKASVAALEGQHGPLPPTVESVTGKGRHRLYAYPADRRLGNRTGVRSGLDTRGENGYIVAPPSIHVSGRRYAWRAGHAPDDLPLADMPDWLIEQLEPPQPVTPPEGRTGHDANGSLQRRARQYVASIDGRGESERNNLIFSTAGHIAALQGDAGERLTEQQILDHVMELNRRCDPPLPESEVRDAVASALKNGTPRTGKPALKQNGRPHGKTAKGSERPARAPLPWQPFPLSALPPMLRRFVKAVARATATDPAYAALAVLVVLAGCIGNRVAAIVRRGWVEPAVLWGALIGRSGTTKSAVLKIVARPLVTFYKSDRKAYQARLCAYASQKARYDAELKKAQRGEAAAAEAPTPPEPPKQRRILVSDVTPEKLACILEESPLGTIVVRDELGAWVGSFDRYRSSKGGADQPTWLSFYDAAAATIDRKAGGTYFIERAAVSVLGTIQPGTLERLFGIAERESGLLARILVAYPPAKPGLWTDEGLPDELAECWFGLLEKLVAEEPGRYEDGSPEPRFLPIGIDAKPFWVEWHDRHAREMQAAEDDDLVAAFGKLKGACVRIALLLALAQGVLDGRQARYLDAESMRRAIEITEWFKHEARRVYGLLSETDEEREQRRLIELIHRIGGSVTIRALMRHSRCFETATAAETALGRLVEAGLGQWVTDDRGGGPGRPAQRFELSATVDVDTISTPTEQTEDSVNVNVDMNAADDLIEAPGNDSDDGSRADKTILNPETNGNSVNVNGDDEGDPDEEAEWTS